MFDKAGLIERFKSGKFRDTKLAARLQELVRDKTGDPMSSLGSEHLRTLLMVVLRNASTDSPWLVSNNPAAKYNALERTNCNLRIPLWATRPRQHGGTNLLPARSGEDRRGRVYFRRWRRDHVQ
jgi:uncharacterized protein